MAQLGADAQQRMGSGRGSSERTGSEQTPPPSVEAKKDEQKAPNPVDVLRGIFGR
jgi:hypothetical protein